MNAGCCLNKTKPNKWRIEWISWIRAEERERERVAIVVMQFACINVCKRSESLADRMVLAEC